MVNRGEKERRAGLTPRPRASASRRRPPPATWKRPRRAGRRGPPQKAEREQTEPEARERSREQLSRSPGLIWRQATTRCSAGAV